MKKIFSYILISILVIANFLAPVSVGLNSKNQIAVSGNKAEAYILDSNLGVSVDIEAGAKSNAIQVSVDVQWNPVSWFTHVDRVVAVKLLDGTQYGDIRIVPLSSKPGGETAEQIGMVEFDNLTPSTTYSFDVLATENSMNILQGLHNVISWPSRKLGSDELPIIGAIWEYSESSGVVKNGTPYEITTLPNTSQSNDFVKQDIGYSRLVNGAAFMPDCNIMSSSTWGGCIGVVLYRLIFQPTAYIFAMTGKIFDYTFNYSILDSSYRAGFVTQGWGIIRDMCNIFFIFILLYIAIGTILDLSDFHTKQLIIHVVIIGLFINFSLFATQVIIDASNIAARVFYNQITVTHKSNGKMVEMNGSFGEKSISAALVSKINPQQIIFSASEAGTISSVESVNVSENGKSASKTVTAATFIMVTILASILNVVGLFVFLTVSLLFISRVIGLWIAMILSPIVFFSYAVPKMDNIEMIGWKRWWPETLKLAFLVPVFAFFMYIIIMFLNTGLSIINADGKTGLDFFIAIMVPFAFLAILMLRAKSIAKDMSGTIGQQITSGVATVGSLALGGAALGGAFLGRKFIGQGLAKASRGETASQQYMDKDKRKEMGVIRRGLGFVGSGFGTGYGINKAQNWAGNKLNEKQKEVNKVDHARHITDEAINKVAPELKGKSWNQLTKEQQNIVKERVGKEEHSKHLAEAEDKFRSQKGNEHLLVKQPLTKQEEVKILDEEKDKIRKAKGPNYILSAQDTKDAEDKAKARIKEENKDIGKLPALSVEDRAKVKSGAIEIAEGKFKEELEHAAKNVGMFTRAFSKANTGTYDIRNLSQMKADKREGILTKVPTALIAGVALGVRTGLKSGMGIDHGKGQGNLLKDLGSTLTEALKNVKIDVPKTPSGGGGHGGGDSHGGGHGGGHH